MEQGIRTMSNITRERERELENGAPPQTIEEANLTQKFLLMAIHRVCCETKLHVLGEWIAQAKRLINMMWVVQRIRLLELRRIERSPVPLVPITVTCASCAAYRPLDQLPYMQGRGCCDENRHPGPYKQEAFGCNHWRAIGAEKVEKL